MTRSDKLAMFADGHVPVAWQCGHHCELRTEHVTVMGVTFEVGWSSCHGGPYQCPLRDLLIDFFARELGLRCIDEQAFRLLARNRGGASTHLPLAVNGHYSRRLVCIRDAVRGLPAATKRRCDCGRVVLFSVHKKVWKLGSKIPRFLEGELGKPYYRRIRNQEWIPDQPRECDLFEVQMFGEFCSASCWLQSRLAWRKQEAAKLRQKREMEWIKKAQHSLKEVQRYLSQPGHQEVSPSR